MTERLPPEAVTALKPWVEPALLRRLRAGTSAPWSWIPVVLATGAVTFGSLVCFRAGRYHPATARGLALIAHEAQHIRQYDDLGTPRFLLRYLIGQVRCGFRHAAHPMERDAIALQREIRQALRDQGAPDT